MIDITPRKLEDLTLGEVIGYYSEDFQRKNGITIGTKIPVKSEFNCWVCRKPFLAQPYESYCSNTCQEVGEDRENNV